MNQTTSGVDDAGGDQILILAGRSIESPIVFAVLQKPPTITEPS
jgi:hypothetical protein